MSIIGNIRHFHRTVWAVAAELRVLVMVFAIAIGPLGLSFQNCHCAFCENICLEDSCCCSIVEAEATCGCDQQCSGEQLCDSGAEQSSCDLEYDVECGCKCHVCQGDLGLAVDPEKIPAIKEAQSHAISRVRWCVDLPAAHSRVVQRYAFKHHLNRDIQTLHCRWLI